MIESFFVELLNNKSLVIAALSWFVAGVLKMFVELIVNKTFDIKRIVGAGGMPSSHTATVVALLVATGYFEGINSNAFATTVILAIIVIHDAVGVRFETGKQAKVLNTMMFESDAFKDLDFERQLKEYVGHTPLQVLMGGIVGLISSFVMINMFK